MRRPFTMTAAVLLLLLALFHLLRLLMDMPIVVGTQPMPMWGSIAHILVAGILSWGLLREARR